MPYLTLLSEDGHGTNVPILSGRPFTIGRGAASSLRIRDLKMSRVHCELSVSGGIAIITDLGSMNGTQVNGKRVASTSLKDGDLIRAGYTQFRYHQGELNAAGAGLSPPSAPPSAPSVPEPSVPPLLSAPEAPPKPRRGVKRRKGEPATPKAPQDVAPARDAAPVVRAEEPAEPEPQGPDDKALAQALRIERETPERLLRKGEAICASCRRVVTAKELKVGAATNIHGQVCCPDCIASDPLLGLTVSGYRVDGKLGAGVWSVTYKAEQLSMARAVVLRVLQPKIARDKEMVTQFLAAVKRGGQISHPNLARVYDIGRSEELCYVCSEYIDGESLRQVVRGRKNAFSVEEAADVMLPVASAVDIAHRREVFHRDIRPSNIILNDEGIPKLLGLGFAKSLEDVAAGGGIAVRHAADLLFYWAPECTIEPTHASREADVYSLGAVLYGLLAGHPPIEGKDPVELIGRIRRLRPKPLDALRNDVPHRFSAVIAKAMAKNPADRYADCQQFIDDLRGAAG